MPSTTYPAIKHYWFGKAYTDLKIVIKDSHQRNVDTASDYWSKITDSNWFLKIFYGTTAASVVVGGTFVWLIIVPIHASIVGVIALAIMASFLVLDAAERIYLLIKGWTTICRSCGERIALPEFQCPKCMIWHSQLRPSSYGVWTHRCKCGHQLSCSFIGPRHQLKARCPHDHAIIDADIEVRSTTSVIALVGPPNSGKTCFQVAAFKGLRDSLAKANGFSFAFSNRDSEAFIEDELKTIICSGSTRKTVEYRPSAVSAVLEKPGHGKHQVLLFDAAGEVYQASDRLHQHNQFKHLTGTVLLLDPFSLNDIRHRHMHRLKAAGLDHRVATTEIIDILDRFLFSLQRHFGVPSDRVIASPLAIAVTKLDLLDLGKELPVTVNQDLTQHELQASSQRIRDKLIDWGAMGFVAQVERRFSNVAYFAIAPLKSSDGSSRAELNTVGVSSVLNWILIADKPKLF